MAQLNEIRLDPSTLAQLQAFASARHLEPAELANEALIAGLAAIEERLFWEDRRRGANVPKALEILRNAGKDNSPDPGDELPDNLKCLLDEHER